MFKDAIDIEFGGISFSLLANKCLWQVQAKHLFIADCHFGKINHFRKHGIAVPRAAALSDLERLRGILVQYQPDTVFFLGDLFHSHHNAEWTALNDMISQFTCQFILVKGNHDIMELPAYNSMQVCNSYPYNQINLCHEPQSTSDLHICGHLHPGTRVSIGLKTMQTFPCFYMHKNQLVLPAFGGFTGSVPLKKSPGTRTWALLNNKIFES